MSVGVRVSVCAWVGVVVDGSLGFGVGVNVGEDVGVDVGVGVMRIYLSFIYVAHDLTWCLGCILFELATREKPLERKATRAYAFDFAELLKFIPADCPAGTMHTHNHIDEILTHEQT